VKRGAAYRGKGELKMAVIDYQTAAQPLALTVTETSAPLQDGQNRTATVKQGQTLSVTRVENLGGIDWLWAASVDGNDAARGWIQMKAVEPKPAEPPPAVATQPAATVQPTTAGNSGYAPSNQNTHQGQFRPGQGWLGGWGNQGWGSQGYERSNPAADAAETKLDRLYDRYDRTPTRSLERQIDMQERRVGRMRGE